MTSNELNNLLLNLAIFAPILGIPLLLFLRREWAKYTAFAVSLLPLLVGVCLYVLYRTSADPSPMYERGFVFHSSALWFTVESFDIKFMTGVDGISAYMVLLTALIFPMLIIYSWGRAERQEKLYYLMLLVMETGALGFFLSLDMLMLYVFYEMVLIPACFFIGLWGGAKREQAAMKFFIYTLAGSVVMLVSIIYMGLNVTPGILTTDYFALRDATLPLSAQQLLFWGFAISFAIKVPLFPLHTWQPLAYSESSNTGSVILAAILSKMGAYGFIRFCLAFFPEVSLSFAPIMATLAVVSIVYGAMLAMVQTNIKKLIAYASVSHLGFIVLGIFAMTPEAMSGAVLHMVGHGITTAALFLLAGMIFRRYKTKDIRSFQGIAKRAPVYAFLFMITILASIGLPGLSGFVGEFTILIGAFDSLVLSPVFAVIGATAMVITAVYFLNFTRNMMFGGTAEPIKEKFSDLRKREMVVIMPLVAFMFILGIYTTPYLNLINKGSGRVLEYVMEQAEGEDAPLTDGEQPPAELILVPEQMETVGTQ